MGFTDTAALKPTYAVLPIHFIFFTPHVTIMLNIIIKLDEMY